MTEQEIRYISAAVIALWPRSGWPDATIAVAQSMFRELDLEATKRAITELSREGREYAPPPGLVWVRADAIARQTQPRLPEAEASPGDWERSRGFAFRLRQAVADLARRKDLNITGGTK